MGLVERVGGRQAFACVSVSSKRLDEAKDQTAESETYLDYDQIPRLFLSLENINVTAGT